MVIEKCVINLAKRIANCVKAGDKTSLWQTKPVDRVNFGGLKLAQKLEKDTVQLTNKGSAKINKDADDILDELKKIYPVETVERDSPDVVKNVAKGKIINGEEIKYYCYKLLETFHHQYPELFVFLGKEKGSLLCLRNMVSKYRDIPLQIAKDTPLGEIKKTFAEVDTKFSPSFTNYMNMLIMKKYNPDTYKYIMTTDDGYIRSRATVNQWADWRYCPSRAMLKNITPEQLNVMAKDRLPRTLKNIGAYVEDSDHFMRYEKAVSELSKDLSKCRLSTDVELYRGDKTVGMFDSIGIDKNFEKQIRKLLNKNKKRAKKMKITTYDGRYNCEPSTNLYDFLSSKETLTLADAMQAAKFGDEKFLNEVVAAIRKAKVTDTRFKSYSFDKGMAAGWRAIHSGDNTTIIQNATIKKGTQGGYHQGDNKQYEVILNNTPKEMTFQDVVYDKATDTFVLGTTVQNIL